MGYNLFHFIFPFYIQDLYFIHMNLILYLFGLFKFHFSQQRNLLINLGEGVWMHKNCRLYIKYTHSHIQYNVLNRSAIFVQVIRVVFLFFLCVCWFTFDRITHGAIILLHVRLICYFHPEICLCRSVDVIQWCCLMPTMALDNFKQPTN